MLAAVAARAAAPAAGAPAGALALDGGAWALASDALAVDAAAPGSAAAPAAQQPARPCLDMTCCALQGIPCADGVGFGVRERAEPCALWLLCPSGRCTAGQDAGMDI